GVFCPMFALQRHAFSPSGVVGLVESLAALCAVGVLRHPVLSDTNQGFILIIEGFRLLHEWPARQSAFQVTSGG
ncbi:MAG: hypothetical protein KA203_11005, partial [Aquabacterium sp.]|nr:hypothetical protein [Aquabacterium sp.]